METGVMVGGDLLSWNLEHIIETLWVFVTLFEKMMGKIWTPFLPASHIVLRITSNNE